MPPATMMISPMPTPIAATDSGDLLPPYSIKPTAINELARAQYAAE
jgi:hypothetical protein